MSPARWCDPIVFSFVGNLLFTENLHFIYEYEYFIYKYFKEYRTGKLLGIINISKLQYRYKWFSFDSVFISIDRLSVYLSIYGLLWYNGYFPIIACIFLNYLSIDLSIPKSSYLSICLYVYVSQCFQIYLSIYLSIYDGHLKCLNLTLEEELLPNICCCNTLSPLIN